MIKRFASVSAVALLLALGACDEDQVGEGDSGAESAAEAVGNAAEEAGDAAQDAADDAADAVDDAADETQDRMQTE